MLYEPQLSVHSFLLPEIHVKYNLYLASTQKEGNFLQSIHLLHDTLVPWSFGLRTGTAGLQFLSIWPYWVVSSLVLLFRHREELSEKIKSVQISVVKQEGSNVMK